MMLALGLACIAALCAILLRGRQRAWCLGFAVLGCTYLSVSFSPLRSRLSTTHLLEYVHARVVSSSIATFEVSRADQSSILYRVVMIDGTANNRTVSNSVYNSTPGEDILATMEPVNGCASAPPGSRELRPVPAHGPFAFRPPGWPGGRDGRRLVLGGGVRAEWPGKSTEREGRTFLNAKSDP